MIKMKKKFLQFCSVLVTSLVLSSCYLPQDFALDIRFTQNGDFALRYKGELLAINLHKKIQEQNLSGNKLEKEVGIYRRDLARDKSFSEVEYLQDGLFKVKYVYVSNVKRQANYKFLRGDNRIFSIMFDRKNGLVMMEGRDFSEKGRLSKMAKDYEINGKVRIISDVTVLAHNGSVLRDKKTPVYVWDVTKNSKETPKITFILE